MLAGRLFVGCAFILMAYALMPTRATSTLWALVPLTCVCLLVFAVVFVKRFSRIQTARYPVMAALQTLIFSLLIFMVLFAAIAVQLGAHSSDAYSETLNKVDGFYFSVTTLATVGYGDITPVSTTARVITTIQMLGNLVLLGVALRLVSQVVEHRVARDRGASQ